MAKPIKIKINPVVPEFPGIKSGYIWQIGLSYACTKIGGYSFYTFHFSTEGLLKEIFNEINKKYKDFLLNTPDITTNLELKFANAEKTQTLLLKNTGEHRFFIYDRTPEETRSGGF